MSLFYLLGLFDLGTGLIVLLINAIGTYAIAYYIDGPLMPWVAFVFTMGYMSISHIYRQAVADASVVDITGIVDSSSVLSRGLHFPLGAQMVLIMRVWNPPVLRPAVD